MYREVGRGKDLSAPRYWIEFRHTVELHLSRSIGAAGHPDMQKIRIIGVFFENRLPCQSEVRLLLFTVCILVSTKIHRPEIF